MMSQLGSSGVDTLSGTASLDLYVSGELVTSYSYSASEYQFTLSKITGQLTVPRTEYGINIQHITNWYQMIRSQLPIPRNVVTAWCKYCFELEEDENDISVNLKLSGPSVVDIKYVRGQHQMTVKPRPKLVLSPKQFGHFLTALQTLDRTVG